MAQTSTSGLTVQRLLEMERAGSIVTEMNFETAARLEKMALMGSSDEELIELIQLIMTHARARTALMGRMEELRKKHGVPLL